VRHLCAGSVAPLPRSATSLAYTAPEVLAGATQGRGGGAPQAPASTAADIWALGMVAFELLTNERVFAADTSQAAVRATLTGRAPLPWEPSAPGSAQRRQRLRVLGRLILPCLDRDPLRRPTAAQLLRSWWHLLDDMHTQGTFDSAATRHLLDALHTEASLDSAVTQPPASSRADPLTTDCA
jgi:serine/threonine protein kinase